MLAQEFMRLMKGKQVAKPTHGVGSSSGSFANFTGTLFSSSTYSKFCCAFLSNIGGSWIVDTCATYHMTFDTILFTQITKLIYPLYITLPDGTQKQVQSIGNIVLHPNLYFINVLHVPEFKFHLLSVGKLLSTQNLLVMFIPDKCIFQDPTTDAVIVIGTRGDGMYKLDPHALQ